MLLLVLLLSFRFSYSQYKVEPPEGYTLEIGNMVYMLEELKGRITQMVQDMGTEQIDYLIDEDANSIGALILHLASTEAYYQIESLENRSFNKEEEEKWMLGAGLGIASREKIKGKPITHYLDIWDEVRSKTLSGLKQKDDKWFAETPDGEVSHHWAWYHVMEHQAVHMGQISHIKKRIPK
ncbi:DinB family protein [Allomuricauda sp. d1]|uniref:DinB family protein n=1 Tax=Allomuricauda sp. d1 TaxID=3136725 RepID=UPI0031D78369